MDKHRKDDAGADKNNTISTPAVTKLPDGTFCIGLGCASINVNPKTVKFEVDARGCDDEVQNAIADALRAGALADIKIGAKPKNEDTKRTNT